MTSFALAISPAEGEHFFPGPLAAELHALIPPSDRWQPGEDWPQFLAARRPTVLVTHWSTPPLPEAAREHLRYVCHVTGGVRQLLPRSFLEGGLRVTNWGDGAAETVAESTLMLVLAALRQTQHWGREMHERGGWRSGFGAARTLFGRRVAIHGFGRIARALLPLLAPFRTPVAVFSQGVPADFIRSHGAEPMATLEALCASGPDVFIELEALTPATRGQVTAAHLAALPAGALLVNSGRGAVIVPQALEQAALSGHLHLALDVYAVEPLPATSSLRGLTNVTLMPHVGGPTPDRYPACGRFALDNLARWQRGEPLQAELDLSGYDLST